MFYYLATVGLGLYANSAIIAKHTGMAGLQKPPYTLEPRHKVSLVVPAYQEEKYIPMLLQSAQNQTEPIYEMVVADSSPPGDRTGDLARSLGARVIPFEKDNIAGARNAGAAEASGEILLFCDADVVLGNRFVERAVTALEDGYALVHPREGIYDSTPWNMILWGAQIVRPRWNTTRCVAVSQKVFEAVGGYDEKCNPITERCREDLDFGARVSQAYGRQSIKVLPALIATSARRYKAFGTGGWKHFDVPARAKTPMRVTGARVRKSTKQEANYRPATGQDRCRTCRFFSSGRCQVVEGSIDPDFVSDLFQPVQ